METCNTPRLRTVSSLTGGKLGLISSYRHIINYHKRLLRIFPLLSSSLSTMYKTKLTNTKHVDQNAYITVGDPYHDPKANMFRQDDPKAKKTSDKPFGSKVSFVINVHCFRR